MTQYFAASYGEILGDCIILLSSASAVSPRRWKADIGQARGRAAEIRPIQGSALGSGEIHLILITVESSGRY